VPPPRSLDALVRAYLAPKLPPSLSFRPGPLHRLDVPTSGVIFYSRSLRGAKLFTAALRDGRIRKFYLGLTDGIIPGPAVWEDNLSRDRAGKITLPAASGERSRGAVTIVTPLLKGENHSLCIFEIPTGRTHQIRSQAAIHGFPLSGDAKYGGSTQEGGLLLHCFLVVLKNIEAPGFPPRVSAPPPDYFIARVRELFGKGKTEIFHLTTDATDPTDFLYEILEFCP
jgi:23S rRNA pseudouridine955/2504/2580 synthase